MITNDKNVVVGHGRLVYIRNIKIGGYTMVLGRRVEDMFDSLNEYKNNVRSKEIQIETLKDLVNGHDQYIEELNVKEMNYKKATEVFKKISDTRNEEAKEVLEDVLNWALENIDLEQNYVARLEEKESGRSGKELSIILIDTDTGRERSIRSQTGTAIAQIVSFLMNIIIIKFSGSSKIMVLDEVFSGLQDKETIRMFGEILVALSVNEGFQFIIVEHKSDLSDIEGIDKIKLSLTDYSKGLEVVN